VSCSLTVRLGVPAQSNTEKALFVLAGVTGSDSRTMAKDQIKISVTVLHGHQVTQHFQYQLLSRRSKVSVPF
jgi:hypothetical protein